MWQDDNGKFNLNAFKIGRHDAPDRILKRNDDVTDMVPWTKSGSGVETKKTSVIIRQRTASGREFTSRIPVVSTEHILTDPQGGARPMVTKHGFADIRSDKEFKLEKTVDYKRLERPMGQSGIDYPMPKEGED